MLAELSRPAFIVLILILVVVVGAALWDQDKLQGQEKVAKGANGEASEGEPQVSLPAVRFYDLLDELDTERERRRRLQDAMDALVARDGSRFSLNEKHMIAMAQDAPGGAP